MARMHCSRSIYTNCNVGMSHSPGLSKSILAFDCSCIQAVPLIVMIIFVAYYYLVLSLVPVDVDISQHRTKIMGTTASSTSAKWSDTVIGNKIWRCEGTT